MVISCVLADMANGVEWQVLCCLAVCNSEPNGLQFQERQPKFCISLVIKLGLAELRKALCDACRYEHGML